MGLHGVGVLTIWLAIGVWVAAMIATFPSTTLELNGWQAAQVIALVVIYMGLIFVTMSGPK